MLVLELELLLDVGWWFLAVAIVVVVLKVISKCVGF